MLFADEAVFDLLNVVWRAGADLADDLPAVLDHLRDLAEPLTRHAGPPPPADSPDAPALADADAGREEGLVSAYTRTRPARYRDTSPP
jgi:hypothetical protein